MRQRKLKNLDERLEHFKNWIVSEPEKQKGRWREAAREDVPAEKQNPSIRLEIGCGKGRFLTEKAMNDAEKKYIGIEGQQSVIVRAIEKAEKADLKNIMFISGYVRDLRGIFADEEVEGIYLNFSDPWPKKRHASRRLTHRTFLASYKAVLVPGGFIEIRTDNKDLFDFTLSEAEATGFFVENVTEDLYGSDIIKDGIMTEYEEKFSSMGKKIKYVKLIKQKEGDYKKMAEYIMAEKNNRMIPEEDKIFALNARAKKMAEEAGRDKVINATIGSLLDDDGKLVVLLSVVKALKELEPMDFAEYAPIGGTPGFKKAVMKAAFGKHKSSSFVEVVATPGGTGALRNIVANYSKIGDKVLTSDWFWGPYKTITGELYRELCVYPMFDENNRFNKKGFSEKLNKLAEEQESVLILLNTPSHNPTGYSLDEDDWNAVSEAVKEASEKARITLFVDAAYIDFAGDEEEHRTFLPKLENLPSNVLPVIGYSFSKTFTLYGMRCGAMIAMAPSAEIAAEFKLVNEFSARGTWSNSTRSGQVLVSKVYEDKDLLESVNKERAGYRQMLIKRGKTFSDAVIEAGLPLVPFDSGFFSCIPVKDPAAVSKRLEEKGIFVVPLAKGIRISVASVSEEVCGKLPGMIAEAMK